MNNTYKIVFSDGSKGYEGDFPIAVCREQGSNDTVPNDLIGGEGWGEAWREAFIDTGLRAYDLFDYELVSNVSACEGGLGFLNPWTDDNSAFGIRSDDDLQGYTVGEVVGGFGLSWGEGWGGTWQVL